MNLRFLLGMVGLLWTLGGAWAQPAPPEDPLDLVALLVRDGRWDRARTALSEVDPARLRPSATPRYHTLGGLIAAGDDRWEDAVVAFREALAVADETRQATVDPSVVLQLAQALLRSGEAGAAVEVLEDAPEEALSLKPAWLLKARAAQEAGWSQRSWDALEEGGARFPDDPQFLRQQVILLIRLGLYQEAGRLGATLLGRRDAVVEDVLVLAEALKRGGALRRASDVLTQGRLRFPDRVEPWKSSAGLALAQGRPAQAARDLTIAAELDPSLAYEASELWRQAGDLSQALRLNEVVVDAPRKARQRLGLLMEQEAWDLVIALEPRAMRLGLGEEDVVAYGLAYARFRVGDLDGAEAHLKRITDPKVFQLAIELRSAMQACRDDPWACP